MYAKFNVNRDTANDFIRLLVNRRAYSIQAHQPLPNGKSLDQAITELLPTIRPQDATAWFRLPFAALQQ
ncbi:MAG TPA: hypothetical protein VK638_13260 [Edaphobacter sp.]|nr:hypothetical protein [Edaphobacter sp.]